MYARGFLDSRSKDYYDLHILYKLKSKEIDMPTVAKACERTFHYRITEIDVSKEPRHSPGPKLRVRKSNLSMSVSWVRRYFDLFYANLLQLEYEHIHPATKIGLAFHIIQQVSFLS